MKRIVNMQVVALLFLIMPGRLIAQNCESYHLDGDCQYDIRKDYNVYSQSHSSSISPLDTVEFNVVFYGQKDYILSFCTHKNLYPVHFVLVDEQTKEVLYDNQDDDYIESLGLGFDVARPMIIRVDVIAKLSTEEQIKEKVGCIGLLIQYKNYPQKKVKLQL
jgi:hypothetical protein